jgi:4,5-dihydroxyphthalate decarboxylase
MSRVPLSIAISDSDHVRDLLSGAVSVQGADVTYLTHEVEEIFFRFTRFREWDAAELSLGKFCAMTASGGDALVGLPVFLSRAFRHSGIFIRSDGPVDKPSELAGSRIGIPEWTVTATIYQRALLQYEFDVDLAGIDWIQGGVNQGGRLETLPTAPPAGIRITHEPVRSLNDMLLAGEIDAILAPRPPRAFTDGSGLIRGIFSEVKEVEQDYYRRTGIFPIMHLVAVRREVHDRYPWLAANLVSAFTAAKNSSLARLADITSSMLPLPWVSQQLADATGLLGPDPWPYGVNANRRTLEAFVEYAREQGVCGRSIEIDELFPPSVREVHVV